MLDVAISLPRFLFQGTVSPIREHGYDTKNQAKSQWSERGEYDAMRHKRTICRAKTAYSTRHFCLDYTNAAMGWRRDAARQGRKRDGYDARGHARRRFGDAHLRVVGAKWRVENAHLRTIDATRRVVGATCRVAAMGGLVPVVELEPAGDGGAVDSDSEEDVPAPPSAVRLAGRVDVVHERDFCLAGLDVPQLVEDGYRFALVRAEFQFHRVARSECEAASGHDGSRAGVGAEVYLVVGQVALLDAGDCSRRICRDVEFERCHCGCPFVLCFVVVEL